MFLAFAAVYILWGSTYLAILFGVQTIPPFLMAGTRHFSAGLMMLMVLRLRGPLPKPSVKHWRSAAIMGLLMLLGGNGGVTWAEQHVASGLAALLVATVPLWMSVMSWFQTSRSRPGIKEFAGVVLGFVGLGILTGPEEMSGGEPGHWIGMAVLIGAALSWSAGSVYNRKAPHPGSPFLAAAMQMLCGGLMLIILGTVTGEWSNLYPDRITLRSGLSLLYLILFGSLIGFSAYIWLLKHTTPAKAATYAYVNPLVAVLIGWLWAGEALTLRVMAAAVIIIGSVVIITWPQRPDTRSVKRQES